MRAYFETLGDLETAGKFRPSSMEHVRSLGGDPLTLVSEVPLFVGPRGSTPGDGPGDGRSPGALLRRLRWDPELASRAAADLKPVPVEDQMRLQLELIHAGLRTTCLAEPGM
jgi:hypothetical protein